MPKLTEKDVECLILTYKEGLLSKVAHDLKLKVGRLSLDIADDVQSAQATFDLRSMTVICAVKDGIDAPGTLSDKDKRQVLDNMAKDVLDSRRYPQARFESRSITETPGGWRVTGALTLAGKARDVDVTVRRLGSRLAVEARLHTPTWGIKPFSALMGTLKVKPDVDVRLSLAAFQPRALVTL